MTNVLKMNGHVFQVNASQGGLPKLARGSAQVTILGLAGDQQKNTHVHGGVDRALCLYSLERIIALQQEGHPIFPGAMGENLTLAGISWEAVTPGVKLRLGEHVLVEVTKYTTPCNSLAQFFKEGEYGRVSQTQYPGWARVYVKVWEEGPVQISDPVIILE